MTHLVFESYHWCHSKRGVIWLSDCSWENWVTSLERCKSLTYLQVARMPDSIAFFWTCLEITQSLRLWKVVSFCHRFSFVSVGRPCDKELGLIGFEIKSRESFLTQQQSLSEMVISHLLQMVKRSTSNPLFCHSRRIFAPGMLIGATHSIDGVLYGFQLGNAFVVLLISLQSDEWLALLKPERLGAWRHYWVSLLQEM